MKPSGKPELILIGGGGHCAACIDVIEAAGTFAIAGIVDSDPNLQAVCGYQLIGNDSELAALRENYDHALISVGQIRDVSVRVRLFALLTSLGFQLPTIISPRAYVSRYATLGKGSIVMHDALVNARAQVGNNCIVNSKALIEHDAVVEDHCHISTGAIINGGALIRQESFVGSHAVTVQGAIGRRGDFIKAATLFRGYHDE